jgi:hypothetical protein
MSARWFRCGWLAALVPVLLLAACSEENEGVSYSGFIFFTTEPQGARILLRASDEEGESEGEFTDTGQVTPTRVEARGGKHEWRLVLEGYALEEGTVTITGPGQTKRVERSGENDTPPLRRLVTFTLGIDPAEAPVRIIINEATVTDVDAATPGFQLTLPETLPGGTHRLQATAGGFFEEDQEIRIARSTRTIPLVLLPLPEFEEITFHLSVAIGGSGREYSDEIVIFNERDFDRGLRGINEVETAIWGLFEVKTRIHRTFEPRVIMLFNGRDPRTFQQVVRVERSKGVGELINVIVQNANLVPGESRGVFMQAGEYEVQIVWRGQILTRGPFTVKP